jgi:hypothetical protein
MNELVAIQLRNKERRFARAHASQRTKNNTLKNLLARTTVSIRLATTK